MSETTNLPTFFFSPSYCLRMAAYWMYLALPEEAIDEANKALAEIYEFHTTKGESDG